MRLEVSASEVGRVADKEQPVFCETESVPEFAPVVGRELPEPEFRLLLRCGMKRPEMLLEIRGLAEVLCFILRRLENFGKIKHWLLLPLNLLEMTLQKRLPFREQQTASLKLDTQSLLLRQFLGFRL